MIGGVGSGDVVVFLCCYFQGIINKRNVVSVSSFCSAQLSSFSALVVSFNSFEPALSLFLLSVPNFYNFFSSSLP